MENDKTVERESGGEGDQSEASLAAASPPPSSSDAVEVEELLIHIKGIKFQNPHLGVNGITKELQKLGPRFASINAKRVRKHMKKHGLLHSQLEADNERAGVLRLFTVGDGSKPHKSQLPKESTAVEENDSSPALGPWVAVELRVPCDRSGTKKFQATISMAKAEAAVSTSSGSVNHPLYKIQVAAGPDDAPMLMYNENKSQTTYIHPDAPGFQEIRKMVVDRGVGGAIQNGGKKAFFFGRQSRHLGRNVVLIRTDELGPMQIW